MVIRIGTRTSRLAMYQTELVRARILALFPDELVEVVPIVTQGDRELNRSLASFGGKGVFTKEIEEQLQNQSIDIAVHSAKDVPLVLPEGLCIGAALDREDVRDVLVTRSGQRLADMPEQSVIGTSSQRRMLQVKAVNPKIVTKDLRGNVPTRLDKLRSGAYDGIVLAAAGLKRLHLDEEEDLNYEYLRVEQCTPAAGQGILALEVRCSDVQDGFLAQVLRAINVFSCELCLAAERAFLAEIGGGCNAPCGAYCEVVEKEDRDGCANGWGENAEQEALKLWMRGMYDQSGGGVKRAHMTQVCATAQEAAVLGQKLGRRIKSGCVSLVGAGPLGVEMMSVAALQRVREADVIIYDNLVSPSILNEARLDARLIYVGKRAGAHYKKQDEINECMYQEALTGCDVVRLKGGDAYIFGRGGEEMLYLRERGICCDVVSGISSCYSIPAKVGIPVTHRGAASSVHVITGHVSADGNGEVVDYEALAKLSGTLVFLMGLHNLPSIVSQLVRYGKSKTTPVSVIQSVGTRQRVAVATLEHIEQEVKRQKIGTPAIIVVGEVNRLREHLLDADAAQGDKSLCGKRILLTASRGMVEKLTAQLKPHGADVTAISLIETATAQDAVDSAYWQHLQEFRWIVFTSSAGVRSFFELLRKRQIDQRKLALVRFAVVGSATARTLLECGYQADRIPPTYTSKALADMLVPELGEGERVLLVCGRGANRDESLEQALEQARAVCERAVVYEVRQDLRRGEEIARVLPEMDVVVVCSGSAAQTLFTLVERVDVPIVAIGPATRRALLQCGCNNVQMAAEHTAEGIVKCLLEEDRKEGK